MQSVIHCVCYVQVPSTSAQASEHTHLRTDDSLSGEQLQDAEQECIPKRLQGVTAEEECNDDENVQASDVSASRAVDENLSDDDFGDSSEYFATSSSDGSVDPLVDPNESEFDVEQLVARYGEGKMHHSSITKLQAMLLVLSYVVTSGISWTQVDGLLKLLNTLLGVEALPATKFAFRNMWKAAQTQLLRYHYFCKNCYSVLHVTSNTREKETVRCEICKKDYTLQCMARTGSFFVIFNLKAQLQHLLKITGNLLVANLQKLRMVMEDCAAYADLTDGDLYKRARSSLQMKWTDLTLTFNTDGAPVFKSSKASVWPIQLMNNELPIPHRFHNIIVAGLWFAKEHPPMHIFLKSFTDEFNKIGEIVWTCPGQILRSRVYILCCCVDSPARAALLNMKQFNGYYGCPWCLQRGTLIEGMLCYAKLLHKTPFDRHKPGILYCNRFHITCFRKLCMPHVFLQKLESTIGFDYLVFMQEP